MIIYKKIKLCISLIILTIASYSIRAHSLPSLTLQLQFDQNEALSQFTLPAALPLLSADDVTNVFNELSSQQQPNKRKRKRHRLLPLEHKCNNCSKKFTTPSKVERHQAVHAQQKNFQCLFCENSFAQDASLKRHQKSNCHVIKQANLAELLQDEFLLNQEL